MLRSKLIPLNGHTYAPHASDQADPAVLANRRSGLATPTAMIFSSVQSIGKLHCDGLTEAEGWLIAEDKNERGERPPRPHCPAPRRSETLGLLSFHLECAVTNSEGCRSYHRGHLGTGDPAKADHHPETQWPTDCIDQTSDNRTTTTQYPPSPFSCLPLTGPLQDTHDSGQNSASFPERFRALDGRLYMPSHPWG